MLIGHYIPALLAHSKYKNVSFLLLMFACQIQEAVWLLLHYFGSPTNPLSVLEAKYTNVVADLTYSHDLIPLIFYSVIMGTIGRLIYKDWKIGFTFALLVVSHFILDFIAGLEHGIFGRDTLQLGFNLYASNPLLGLIIEIITVIIGVFLFVKLEARQGNIVSKKKQVWLYSTFILAILLLLPNVYVSFGELFNISWETSFSTLVPTLIFLLVLYAYIINYIVIKMD